MPTFPLWWGGFRRERHSLSQTKQGSGGTGDNDAVFSFQTEGHQYTSLLWPGLWACMALMSNKDDFYLNQVLVSSLPRMT